MRLFSIGHEYLWRWRARSFRRQPRQPAVLLYHSVGERERDPLLLSVTPARFESHLAWLRKHRTLLSLEDWVQRAAVGTLPIDAVAITFDDAYLDNHTVAAPLLRAASAQATVFVATDLIGSETEPWWEELDALLLEAERLPSTFAWQGEAWSLEPSRPAGREGWSVLAPPVTQREVAFLSLSERAKRLGARARADLLAALRLAAGGARPCRPDRRIMNLDTLRKAATDGSLSFGAHTCSHSCLAALPLAEQVREISESRTRLASWLGSPVPFFAYPFGTYRDFTPATVAAVRSAGFAASFANMTAAPRLRRPDWEIPRVWVGNWPVEELASRLGL